MGLFNKWTGSKDKSEKDPIIETLRSLGSMNEKIRGSASKKLLDMGPAVIQYLLAIVENKQAENQWIVTETNLESLDYNVRRGVTELIDNLNSTNAAKVKTASQKLRSLPPDTKKLIESLSSLKNARNMEGIQRLSAIGILSQINIPPSYLPQVIQTLVGALADESSTISEPSVKLLLNCGIAAVPCLANALSSTNKTLKVKSISILEKIELTNSDAVPALIGLLTDESQDIRSKAVKILGNMKGLAKDAIIPLLGVCDNTREVQTALVNIGPSDLDALVQGLNHKNDDIKISASDALGGVGPNAQIALANLYNLLKNNNEKVKGSAAKAIYNIHPDPSGIRILIESLADNNQVVQNYVRKSLALYGETAIPYLIRELSSNSLVIKLNASEVLGLMKSEAAEALPELERLLDDEDTNVRHGAISAIGNIGCIQAHLSAKLLDVWKQSGDNLILEVLSRIKEPKVIEILLRAAFNSPHDGTPDEIKKCLMFFSDTSMLNDKIISWAVDASTYQHKFHGYQYDAGYISLDLSNNAILSLCNVNAPITNNILCMVAEKKDISITMSTGCTEPRVELLSFQNQRDMALKELAARGNPLFNSSYFMKSQDASLDDANHKIEIEAQNEKERRYTNLLNNAKNPNRSLGDDKWKFYEILVKEFKSKEVFQLLISDLVKYKTIPLGDLNRFEWLLIQTAQGLQDQDVANMLYPIHAAWPNLYASVLKRSAEMKKTNSND